MRLRLSSDKNITRSQPKSTKTNADAKCLVLWKLRPKILQIVTVAIWN